MNMFAALQAFLLVLALFCTVSAGRADDFNDGIAADDGVEKYNDINNTPTKNFSYLAQRARSKAASGGGNVIQPRDGALNSVIMEPGAKLNGDIVIVDQSRGNRTIINE
jgi:hypothetical protein